MISNSFILQGQILVNGEETEEIDIVAKNGRIYTLAGVLIPPSIVPILPHRCDGGRSEIKMVRKVSTTRFKTVAIKYSMHGTLISSLLQHQRKHQKVW